MPLPDTSAPPPREAWLRGPVAGVPALVQPVAHALVQARDEVAALAAELPPDALWDRPGGAASAGFHLAHLAGVLDRMLTYARGEPLAERQLAALASEGVPNPDATPVALADAFARSVDAALAQLRATDPTTLTDARTVGRQQILQTHIGLLVHAAEHTTRHVGQLLVTVRVVTAGPRQ
ncbi:DinB family protein [Rubrivirga sp. IMCC45206]|uniref:DinB family protein n=1 Tax=Rubrivirga sp. IMCC45206 TaxID=3391614 RepID=UPI00398FA05F